MLIPTKIRSGDELRIISPSRSLAIVPAIVQKNIKKRFKELGFKLTFSKHVKNKDIFLSSSIKDRLEDIHQAFKDSDVKLILTTRGGFNSNQLLSYLDYNLIRKNPKILCGNSDITALLNAIYAKTGLVTYLGPTYSSFGEKLHFNYTLEYFRKCLFVNNPFNVLPSDKWSDDKWWKNQNKRILIKNKGYQVINEGKAEGIIIGGNLCTFNLLQGTEFMPNLDNTILFIEEDSLTKEHTIFEFDRNLQSPIHQPDFDKVKGIVIGRFQKVAKAKKEMINGIIKSKKELNNIPVVYGVDFGHTSPRITIPIGGISQLIAKRGKIELKIIKH